MSSTITWMRVGYATREEAHEAALVCAEGMRITYLCVWEWPEDGTWRYQVTYTTAPYGHVPPEGTTNAFIHLRTP